MGAVSLVAQVVFRDVIWLVPSKFVIALAGEVSNLGSVMTEFQPQASAANHVTKNGAATRESI